MAYASFSQAGKWIVVKVRPNNNQIPKLGITVTRRYGKAHDRNRFKRLVRESFRLSKNQFYTGLDILVIPRTFALEASLGDIQQEFVDILNKASIHFNSK